MALHRFERLAIFQADDGIGRHRLLDRHGRHERPCGSGSRLLAETGQSGMSAGDQAGQIGARNIVMGDIGRDDHRREANKRFAIVGHSSTLDLRQ